MSGKTAGALSGIRVVDLTSVVFGPYATQTLGDMGADVIKVEAPEGDVLRGVTPTRTDGMGVVFMNINRNKRSIVLDLKQPAHRAALDRIVATADVFIHSIRPKAAERLGIPLKKDGVVSLDGQLAGKETPLTSGMTVKVFHPIFGG